MQALALSVTWARALSRVTARRLRQGPLRPSWSYGFECVVGFLKENSLRVQALSPEGRRAASDAMPVRDPELSRVTFERVKVAGLPAAWCSPKGGHGAGVVLYLHGGSYQYGSIRTHRALIARLALASGVRVLALEYRLAPEFPFPSPVDDAVAALRWLRAQGVERVVLSGDSAGGGLALASLLWLRDHGEPLPEGAALFSPWVDLAARGGSLERHSLYDWAEPWMFEAWARDYLQGADPRDPLASPVYADLRGLPPCLVELGAAEMLFDQVTCLVTRMKDSGVTVGFTVTEDMVHNWAFLAAMFPGCGAPLERAGRFCRERLGSGREG